DPGQRARRQRGGAGTAGSLRGGGGGADVEAGPTELSQLAGGDEGRKGNGTGLVLLLELCRLLAGAGDPEPARGDEHSDRWWDGGAGRRAGNQHHLVSALEGEDTGEGHRTGGPGGMNHDQLEPERLRRPAAEGRAPGFGRGR